jgi:hypothetical protein
MLTNGNDPPYLKVRDVGFVYYYISDCQNCDNEILPQKCNDVYSMSDTKRCDEVGSTFSSYFGTLG